MQRIKSFFGWGFAAFFGILFLGSWLAGSSVGMLVLLIWTLICLPPVNRLVLGQGVRHWVWWKVGVFVIGLFLIGTAEPETPTATIDPPPVISSPATSEPIPLESPTVPDRRTAQVISVGDGDTLRAQVDGEIITVRLACIDAPESAQPQGQQATDRLQALLPEDSLIELRTIDTDRYGRTVAEVYQDGQSINLQLIQEGHAIVYSQYLDGCAATREQYLEAEARAKEQQLAFWSQEEQILPWDWRSGVRPTPEPSPAQIATPEPEPQPAIAPSPTPVANGPIRSPVSGSCECPYDTDRAGRRCGERSAYSRPGGSQPVCYFKDR